MSITITSDDLDEIKSSMGYPLYSLPELQPTADDYIKKYVVSRVLRTYFTYYPIIHETSQNIVGAFEVSYPEDDIFRLLRHFFNYKLWDYSSFSPFILQAMVLDTRPYGQSGWGPQGVQEVMSRLSTAESMVDWTKAIRVDDYPNERKVRGSSNISGDMFFQWAKKSDDFSDIPYNHKDDALKLSKAYLVYDVNRIRSQSKITSKVDINMSELVNEAQTWEKEVILRWKTRVSAVIGK